MKVIKFAPGLIPVFKHQQHDQSSHGNWAHGSSFGDFTLEEGADSKKLAIYSHPNGTRVIFQNLSKVESSSPMVKETLETISDLSKKYPVPNLTFVVQSGEGGGIVPRGMDGATFTPGDGTNSAAVIDAYIKSKGMPAANDTSAPYISVRLRVVAPDSVPRVTYTSDGGGFIRPEQTQEQKTANLRELITHEWGHALDTRSQAVSDAQFRNRDKTSTTDYGNKNGREFFAETFAAFELGGLTRNKPDNIPDYKKAAEYLGIDSLKAKVSKESFEGFIVYDNFETGEPLLMEGGTPLDFDEPFTKHQEHDQSTHGSWAGDGVSFEQDRNSLTMQDKSGQTLASVDFVNLGNNRLDINSIDSFDGGKGYATKVLEKLYSLFPEHSIFWGKTIVPESTHLAQKFSDKYGRTEFMPWGEGVIAGYEWGQLYGDTTVKKHQEHDQSTHGSWATGQTGDASTRELLLQQASQYETFEEFSNAVSLQGLRPRAWHIADTGFELDPNFKPMSRTGGTSDEPGLFVGDPETWQDYAAGRSTVIEYDVSNLSFTAKPLADTSADFFPDQSGNQGFFIRPSAFSRLREVRRMPIEEALSRAKQQQDAMPKSKAEAKQIWEESRSIQKHAMHDQKTHGNWATGGNGLGIEEVMRLHKTSDPLKMKVYEAEQSIDKPSKNPLEKPALPKRDDYESREDYDKAYKDYSKKWMDWAVEAQASILSDTGKKFLDGTPAGVKKYVEAVIKQDWFIERFGDGSSLPKVDVKTSNTNAAGRHILKMQKDRASGRIIKTVHEISIDRQSTKNERVLLHEITHYATAITQTEAFSAHGAEFARNHIFVVEQMSGSARAEALATAYTEKGVQIDD